MLAAPITNKIAVRIINCKIIGNKIPSSIGSNEVVSQVGIWSYPVKFKQHNYYYVGECDSDGETAYICQCGLAFKAEEAIRKHKSQGLMKNKMKPNSDNLISIEDSLVLEYLRKQGFEWNRNYYKISSIMRIRKSRIISFVRRRNWEEKHNKYSFLNASVTPDTIVKAQKILHDFVIKKPMKPKSTKLKKRSLTKAVKSCNQTMDMTTPSTSTPSTCSNSESDSVETSDVIQEKCEQNIDDDKQRCILVEEGNKNDTNADDEDDVTIVFEGPSRDEKEICVGKSEPCVENPSLWKRSRKIKVLETMRQRKDVKEKHYFAICKLLAIDLMTVRIKMKYDVSVINGHVWNNPEINSHITTLVDTLWEKVEQLAEKR